MKRYLIFIILFNIIPFIPFAQNREYVAHEVIVQLKPDAEIKVLIESFNSNNPGQNIFVSQKISDHSNIWLLKFEKENIEDQEFLKLINRQAQVLHSQFNHYISYRTTPNDPQLNQQWPLHNTGQLGGSNDADIDALEAWNITTGGYTPQGDTIVIAVIDNGFDLNHEDFNGVFWKNYAEIPGDSIDNDNNGVIDDFNGYDFILKSDAITGGFHGMPVTGIIGARGNNSTGITGINWNIKILPVVAAVNEAAVVQAYDYILGFRKKYNETNGAEGAFVVATNSSWGLDFGQPSSAPIWCAMYDSLGKYGILNAAATMNLNQDVDVVGDLPTACPSDHLISVTNTDQNDVKVTGAAFGKTTIDIGAPGHQSFSTYPNNGYASFCCTSAASPHVAGAIGLIYSTSCPDLIQAAKIFPDSISKMVKSFILDGADKLSSLENITVSEGRLNLYKSLLLAENFGNCQLASVDKGLDADADQLGILGLFPNPADQIITINYINAFTGNNQFIISNTLGQTVLQTEDEIKGKGAQSVTIDISHLSPGIYFLYIASGYKQSNMHKFIVQ